MTDKDYPNLSSQTEHALEKLYVTVSAVSLASAIGFALIIILNIGFTSFSVLQSIGMVLLIMVIASAILSYKKKQIFHELLKKLEDIQQDANKNTENQQIQDESQISEQSENHQQPENTLAHYSEWLSQRMTDFELTHQLMTSQRPTSHPSLKSSLPH